MNQYPAFMPMVVPRPYMVAMPANALQMAPPGLAGMGAMAGMGGMAAMSGMAPGVLPHPSLQMVNPQLAAAQLAAAHGNPVTTAGAMPMMATGIPGMTQGIPMPPGSLAMGGLGAMAGLMDMKRGILGTEEAHRYAGAELQQLEASLSIKPEVQLEDVKPIVLDPYNSDLHLEIDEDSCGACPLTEPSGFCFVWAGARATHGVCTGKVFYEIHITENLPVDFGHDHNETNPHIIRVGWSVNSSTFQLGEEPMSYGYGGTSKFSTNNKFSNYGEIFGAGDVIGAMLDLDSTPATISYMKNGTWLGIAMPIHGYQVGNDKMALFPHILSKNCRFRVNFGQIDPWFQPPRGYTYLEKIPGFQRVRGLIEPERFEDCEMIMVVGLPGAGKTLWGVNMEKNHPEKRYNVMGSDTLIDRMKVMGLPRKRNYHGRWEVLIDKSTKCLNRIFKIACKKKRNYVLDQTNVYASARKRKMKDFQKYYRIAAVIQPENVELERRSYKRTHEDGKFVPDEAVREMKANYSLPTYEENLFDRIDFIELQREAAEPLVRQYNDECKHLKKKQQPFRNDRQNQEKGQYGAGGQVNYPLQDQYYGQQGGGYQGRYGNQGNTGEPASKRSKMEPGSALDFIKQEYAEEDKEKALKDEPKWDKNQYGGDLYSQAVNFQFQDQFAHLRPDPFQVLQGQFMQPRPPISEDMLRQLAQSKPPAWPQEKEAVISWLPKSDPQEQGLYPFFPGRQFQGSSVDWQRNESQQGNWSSTVKEKSQSQQWQQSGSVGQSPSTVPSGRSSFDNSSYDKSGSSSSFDEQKFGQSKSFQGDQSKSSYGRPDQSRQFDRNRDDQNRSVGQQDQDDQYHKQRESGNYMNRSDNESSNRNQSYNQREQPQQPQQRYQQGRSGNQSFGSGDEGRGNESRNRSYGQDSSSNKPGSRDYAYGRERRDSSNYRSSSRDSHSYGSRDRDRPDSRISEKSSDGPTHSDSRDTFSSDFRGTERSSGFEPSPSEISSSSDRQSVTPKDSQEIGNGGRVRKRKSKWDVPGEDNGNDSPPVPPVVVKTPANLSAIIAKLEQAGKDHQNAEGKQQTKGSSPHTADTSSKEEKPKDLPSLQDSLQQPPPPPLGMPPTGMSQRPPFPPRGPGFPGGPRFNPHNAPPLPPFGPGSDGPRNFRPRNPQNFGPGHQGPGQWNHPPPFGNGPRGPGGPRGPRGFGGPRGPRGPRGPGGPRGHRPMNPRFGGDGNRFPRPPNMRW